MEKIDTTKPQSHVLTPQPISTAPKDGNPILIWNSEWNAWMASWWIAENWLGEREFSWDRGCIFVPNPQWWLPMPPKPERGAP